MLPSLAPFSYHQPQQVKHMGLDLVPDMISAPIMAKDAGVESVS